MYEYFQNLSIGEIGAWELAGWCLKNGMRDSIVLSVYFDLSNETIPTAINRKTTLGSHISSFRTDRVRQTFQKANGIGNYISRADSSGPAVVVYAYN